MKQVPFMKRLVLISIAIVILLLFILLAWYKIPFDLMNLNPKEVLKIVVFNGNTGNTTHIEDREEIDLIIHNLNSVKLQRGKVSVKYDGYSFITTIYLTNGEEAKGWNNFIINSGNTIRKDPFFYSVVEGNLDYEYIKSIVN